MNKKTTEIIREKGARALCGMKEADAARFVDCAYVGLRYRYDDRTVPEIAKEMDCTVKRAEKLLAKWRGKLSCGNVAALTIDDAYSALRGRKPRPCKVVVLKDAVEDEEHPAKAEVKPMCYAKVARQNSRKQHQGLGFRFSAADDMRIQGAIRDALRFFTEFGKGARPRLHGEYFQPGGAAPDNAVWLTLGHAALYCGCSEAAIQSASEGGEITRRAYRRNGSHSYYEYLCSDLDKFIETYGLSQSGNK